MSIHPSVAWTVTPPEAGKVDLQSVVTHEFGHALGLWHSDVGGALMGPGGNGTRALSTDDKVAISVLYDWPKNLVGAGIDMAVGSTPRLFTLANGQLGDNPVFYMTANGWTSMVGGAGVRISVAGASSPVTVNTAGQVRRHSFLSGANWVDLPGTTAKDVGAGHDGSIWVVGSSPKPGGFGLLKWNGAGWTADNQNVGGVRIAVDSLGAPWIVNSAGDVLRKSHASPTEGDWGTLTRPPGGATDIGVSTRALGNRGGVAWVIAGSTVYAWNGQDQTLGTDANGDPFIVIPAAQQWVSLFNIASGPRTGIATNIYGDPFVAQNSGAITTTER